MGVCNSIDEVRRNIDKIDSEIVRLICERQQYVKQAASFKTSSSDVKAPNRVNQVIAKVRSLAEQENGNANIVEKVYRTMIEEFISMEMSEYQTNQE